MTKVKKIPQDLRNVLDDPAKKRAFKPESDKIYLGQGSKNPEEGNLIPLYLSSEIFSSHVLIGGAIGSGKTSLLMRLTAGTLKSYGTVVIGEAKGGENGGKEGAAFTDLSEYLHQKLGHPVYRWPRGNCWFNPLIYLKEEKDRKAFFEVLCSQIQSATQLSGDLLGYLHNAANIAELILEFLLDFSTENDVSKTCTIRHLVKYLQRADKLQADIQKFQEFGSKNPVQYAKPLEKLERISYQLKMCNFFFLDKPEFAMTRHGVNILTSLLNNEDLFFYSEPHPELPELKIDDILYNRSLVIISQPLSDPSSKIVGPLFWDSLLSRILQLGPNPEQRNGKPRERVLAILDETHRLPVGRLGESGDFLREYHLGLMEILPTIGDKRRWEANQHVYQTIISLSPGVQEVVELIRNRLPNLPLPRGYMGIAQTPQGGIQPELRLNENHTYRMGEDNPGVSARSLRLTGQRTAILQSSCIGSEQKVFWLDLECETMANLKQLLAEALRGNQQAIAKIDRALGLSEF
jgi:hypothetical protein